MQGDLWLIGALMRLHARAAAAAQMNVLTLISAAHSSSHGGARKEKGDATNEMHLSVIIYTRIWPLVSEECRLGALK